MRNSILQKSILCRKNTRDVTHSPLAYGQLIFIILSRGELL